MTLQELYNSLNYVTASREQRSFYAKYILQHNNELPNLIAIVKLTDDPVSCKAGWILDFVARKDITAIVPHIDFFLLDLEKVYLDSCVRPVAKVCEELITHYFKWQTPAVITVVTKTHLQKITELCFDWLIGKQKVAVKAYAMNTLYLLGTKFSWIHKELKLILEQNFNNHTAAYKARAKNILAKLNK